MERGYRSRELTLTANRGWSLKIYPVQQQMHDRCHAGHYHQTGVPLIDKGAGPAVRCWSKRKSPGHLWAGAS